MNNLKTLFLVITILLNSCANFKEDQREIRHIMQLLDGDNSDLYGCILPIRITSWKYREEWGGGYNRIISWRGDNDRIQLERFEGFSENKSESTIIQNNPKYSLIYVGKWHHVKRINKDIRLIGYQNVDKTPARFGFSSSIGEIHHDFEEKTEENEKIKEKKFTLAVIPENHHKQDSECAIKWYDKYGYNAIAETKRAWYPGFWGEVFLKHQLIVTGKIIDAEE